VPRAPLAPLPPPHHPVLASTAWLEANLAHATTARLCIVDIRGVVRPPGSSPRYLPKRDEYEQGHIPGAVFVDWTRDIVDEGDPVPVQIARPDPFAQAMSARGIGDETLVVVYDDYDHIFAGRLAWALRYYGHDAVRILDGGWARWVAEGRPTTRDPSRRQAARFTPRPRPALLRTADEVARALGRDDVLLIDARPSDQYAGAVSAAARSGHIPGARNVPYARLVDPRTGKFLPEAELAAAFAEAGVRVDALPREVVVYCNGGVSCTVPLAALQMLRPDRGDVAVYDGSWNEWGKANAPERPVKSGRDP
jgi:thiosulfate/3-mercaptopyruvate sulfurtransferase